MFLVLEIVDLLRFKSMNGVKVFSKCPEAVPFYCFDLLSLVNFFFFFLSLSTLEDQES